MGDKENCQKPAGQPMMNGVDQTNGQVNGVSSENASTPTGYTPANRQRPKLVGNQSKGVQRGLEILAESEMEQNMSELKTIDSQLDHLNDAVGKLAQKAQEKHGKIQEMLDSQKKSRLQRRASFQQRISKSKQEDDEFADKIKTMLNRCSASRRASVPAFPEGVNPDMLRDTASGE